MTCIVAIAHNNKVYMGSDTYGSSWASGTYVDNPKSFANDEFIIGCTSTFRIIDLLRYKLVIPKVHPDNHDDPDKFMRTIFIDNVKECLANNGHLETKNGVVAGGNFLVGYRGKIYEVQQDFSVLNTPDYGVSVGSGENAARGSLYTTRNMKLSPKKRIELALESAEAVVPSVRGPFEYLN